MSESRRRNATHCHLRVITAIQSSSRIYVGYLQGIKRALQYAIHMPVVHLKALTQHLITYIYIYIQRLVACTTVAESTITIVSAATST